MNLEEFKTKIYSTIEEYSGEAADLTEDEETVIHNIHSGTGSTCRLPAGRRAPYRPHSLRYFQCIGRADDGDS